MKKRLWLFFLLVLIVSVTAAVLFRGYLTKPSEEGLRIVSLESNALLISDADVLSYNLTSQEIAITDQASDRLTALGDSLYSFTDGFVLKIDGEEIYRGVFRMAIHSAIPSPPKISILYPSMLFPSETENRNAIRMFYPTFEPPSNQPETYAKFVQYFKTRGR